MGAGASSASDSEPVVHEVSAVDIDNLRKVIADIDAEDVFRGLSGPKLDEPLLISVLCNRLKGQLKRIDSAYQIKYGKSLLQVAQEDIKGPLGFLVINSLQPTNVAGSAHFVAAFDGFGCDPKILSDILCTYSNDQIESMRQYYDENSKKPLLERAAKELGGDLEKLVKNLIQGSKDETETVDIALSVTQAEKLYKAGTGKTFGTDEDVFIEILSKASRSQIQAVKAAYLNEYKMTLEKAIKKEFTKDTRRMLSGLLCPTREVYIATALNESFSGMGNDVDRVVRLLSMISKSQMPAVRTAYEELYGMNLSDCIKDEFKKGMIREVALTWVAGNDPSQGLEIVNSRVVNEKDDDAVRASIENIKKEHAILLDFIALSDAMAIKRACEGAGTRDLPLIAIICARSRPHLKRVEAYYFKMFSKSLIEQIHEETNGYYRMLMEYAVMSIDEVDAMVVKQACDTFGTNESVLPEALIPLSNKRIQELKARYEAKYGMALVDRLNSEISGVMHQLIMAIFRGERDESRDVDKSLAKTQAKELHRLKVEEGGVDDSTFIDLLTRSSFPQIQRINYEYMKRFDTSLEMLVRGETGGALEDALAALLLSPEDVYATALRRAFKEADTDDTAVARILGSNDKPSVKRIAAKYLERYNQSLIDALEFNLTGHFRIACITYVASANPILPEELKAIVNKYSSDGEERMPKDPMEVPEGRKVRTQNLRSITMLPPQEEEEEVISGEISEGDVGSDHSSDDPEPGAGWEMTPELKKLFNMKREVARSGNKFKTRQISLKIRSLIAEQTGSN